LADGNRRFFDNLYVLLLGAIIAALSWVWQYETPPPDLTEHLAVAAGLRPPTEPLGLLWQHIAAPLCRCFGLQTAETVLRNVGHVSLGLLAVLSATFFQMLLPMTLRRGEHIAAWWRIAVRFVLFQGTALFCLSHPVWNAFLWFSPLALQVLVAILAAMFYMWYFKTSRRMPLFVAFALIGLLSADTPIGAVALIAAIVGICVKGSHLAEGAFATPQENPLLGLLMPFRLTLVVVGGAAVGMALEVRAFDFLDGLAAFGWTWGDYASKFPVSYLKALLSSCAPAGMLAFVAVVILPLMVEFNLFRRATDDEKHLKYMHGVIFFLAGIIAFSQLAGSNSLWFWTWGGGGCIKDGVLKCTATWLSSLSVVWSLAVFTIELYLRNFRRIATLRLQDEAEAEGAAEAFAMTKRLQRTVRTCLLVEPVIVFACVLPFRAQSLERAMLGVVADAVRETSDECRGVDFLFTDGGFDAAVELEAASSGRRLRALSLMGGAADPREKYLRTRGVDDVVDRALLESGAADALRTWVRSRPDKAETYAVQIGFELWRRDERPMPECAGLVARPAGFAPGEAERGAAAGRELAKRILALYEDGRPDDIADKALRDALLFVQWRLAVLSRHRANAYDEKGEAELAMEETSIADALDKKNGALARIRETMAWASRKKLERMTPQEGLRIGLARADFALARVFALKVLDVSPDDPAANFAIGMDFFVQKQYSRAQVYLERCLVHRSNDPAVLNNLAQCRLRQGDPVGALTYAERAQAVLPDSPEIRRTIERIREEMSNSPAESRKLDSKDETH